MKIIIIGMGGHGRMIARLMAARQAAGYPGEVAGYIDRAPSEKAMDLTWLGPDEALEEAARQAGATGFVVGLGSVRADEGRRQAIYERARTSLAPCPALIHPSAIIDDTARIGSGSVVMPGAIINAFSEIGENVIINSAAVIEHDNFIADHVHMASRSVTGGQVSIGSGTLVGTGAAVLQGMKIGSQVTVAAGAVVVRPVADASMVRGVPAR